MIITIISYFFCILYVAYIIIYITGLKGNKAYEIRVSKSAPVTVSVIIPVRNEADNIPKLLYALHNQTYQDFELIIVNDHSTDSLSSVITEFTEKRNGFKLINATGNGKKNALSEGIDQATGNLIVCTDADCLPSKRWIETIVHYHTEYLPDMIIAPVVMMYNNSAFQQMQALEFMSLQAATAGAASANMPIMCNGANLAFTKATWDANSKNMRNDKLSGDDMFLMMSLKKTKGNIAYLKSKDAIVYTLPSKTLSSFFNQRKRWVSKSTGYYDANIILSAFSVLGICLAIIINLILAIFVSSTYWFTFAFIFLVKAVVDRILLYLYGSFTRSLGLLKWAFPVGLVYPFYIVITAFSGLFGKFEWKGRVE